MEVTNVLEMNAHELTDGEKVLVIKNCFSKEGLQLIKTFTDEEKKMLKDYFPCYPTIQVMW